MRAPLYITLIATLSICVRAIEEPAYYGGRQLRPLDVAADQETVRYLLPKLAAKYRPNSEWTDVADPRFYLLTEMESADSDGQVNLNPESRIKRAGKVGEGAGSLSIVNSLDVLRNRLLLEIARKKAKEGANRNRNMLLNLGKRGGFMHRTGIYNDFV